MPRFQHFMRIYSADDGLRFEDAGPDKGRIECLCSCAAIASQLHYYSLSRLVAILSARYRSRAAYRLGFTDLDFP